MKRFAWLFLLVPFALSACQGRNLEAMESVPIVKTVPTTTLAQRADLIPIYLTNLTSKIPSGRQIGTFVYVPLTCDPVGITDISWGRGRGSYMRENAVGAIAAYLADEGITVANDPANPVSGKRPKKIIEVTGAVRDIQINGCRKTGFIGSGEATGDGVVRVDWQIISHESGKKEVVKEITTTGRHSILSKVLPEHMIDGVITEGIGKAAQAMARTPEFLEIIDEARIVGAMLARKEEERRYFEELAVIRVATSSKSTTPIQRILSDVRGSTVRIDIPGGGHGSGFLISSKLVLTNEHVAGALDFTEVVLASGRKVIGEVIRCHEARDVCVILIEKVAQPYLPIRKDPPAIGENIWIVGAPANKGLSGSVTKGILSKYVVNGDGLESLAYDTTTFGGNSGGPVFDEFGNIVGVHFAGERSNGEKVGINYGVPIMDALKHLKIELINRDPLKTS